MLLRRRAVLSLSVLALMFGGMAPNGAVPSSFAGTDEQDIRSLMMRTWDKPGAELKVDPIVIDGGHAVAGWTQSERGGRALLRKGKDGWAVVLCSGDPLKHAAVLAEAGVPATTADHIAELLNEAEGRLPPERLALFATFDGVMRVEGDNRHGAGDGQLRRR